MDGALIPNRVANRQLNTCVQMEIGTMDMDMDMDNHGHGHGDGDGDGG